MTADIPGDLALAIALANLTHAQVEPGRWEREGLRTEADLAALLVEHGWRVGRPPSARDLAEARAVRDRLQFVFGAARTEPEAAVGSLQAMLTDARLGARVQLDDGEAHLRILPHADSSLSERLRTTVALAVADVAERHGIRRLRRCAYVPAEGEGCTRVFVDTSKNGMRRFCRPQCASRAHVGAHRARQRDPSC